VEENEVGHLGLKGKVAGREKKKGQGLGFD
jgi:hypothetical protein